MWWKVARAWEVSLSKLSWQNPECGLSCRVSPVEAEKHDSTDTTVECWVGFPNNISCCKFLGKNPTNLWKRNLWDLKTSLIYPTSLYWHWSLCTGYLFTNIHNTDSFNTSEKNQNPLTLLLHIYNNIHTNKFWIIAISWTSGFWVSDTVVFDFLCI